MIYTTNMTLSRAMVFAEDLVFGEWHEVVSRERTERMTRIHLLECETTYAHVEVCTITGNIEQWKFEHKEGEQ